MSYSQAETIADSEKESSSSPTSLPSPATGTYRCDVCAKIFSRLDHVCRHRKSHENNRTFRCPVCPKRFNRGDLLNRHKESHRRRGSKSDDAPKRALHACHACIASKTKCGDQKPCARCVVKGMTCEWTPNKRGSRQLLIDDDLLDAKPAQPESPGAFSPTATASIAESVCGGVRNTSVGGLMPILDDSGTLDQVFNHGFYQDVDFSFGNFDFDFLQLPGGSASFPPDVSERFNSAHEAFKKSLWLWSPAEQDNAYGEQDALELNESHIGDLPETPPVRRLEQDCRDRLFGMVLETMSPLPARLPSFPSAKILDGLLQVYFLRDREQNDRWIHSPSLNPSSAPCALVGALVAAGSQAVAEESVWKMGLALQEAVRLSVSALINKDNTWTRNISGIQAFRLWMDVGLWSGFKRKMEIAEGFGANVVTMLRRAGAFDRSYYHSVRLGSGEDEENKWREWIEMESTKRCVIHTFLEDVKASVAFSRAPLMDITELSFPLPASERLWSAPTAADWRRMYHPRASSLQITDALASTQPLADERDNVDPDACELILLYGLWSQIWHHQQAKKFFSGSGASTTSLWLSCQYKEIYKRLVTRQADLDRCTGPVASDGLFISELFMMLLHVSPLELQQLAGKSGEDEAQRMCGFLHTNWYPTVDARRAVWHAGQVFRAARGMRRTHLRDIYAVAVYQAALCLWAFGLFKSMEADALEDVPTMALETFTVVLDAEDPPGRVGFIDLALGTPCLSDWSAASTSQVIVLADRAAVMKCASETLRRNFSSTTNQRQTALPPLVDNLSKLLRDLIDLPIVFVNGSTAM